METHHGDLDLCLQAMDSNFKIGGSLSTITLFQKSKYQQVFYRYRKLWLLSAHSLLVICYCLLSTCAL